MITPILQMKNLRFLSRLISWKMVAPGFDLGRIILELLNCPTNLKAQESDPIYFCFLPKNILKCYKLVAIIYKSEHFI